ncbi:MAG TPA: V-type ATP synthase subunit E family protein [Streptosporangiaceae bacterium]
MLRRAAEQAGQILADARREADAIISEGRLSAERAVSQAREAGRREAAELAAVERSRGRSHARSVLLGTRREIHQELCSRVRAAVGGLRDEPGYDRLLERLTGMAREAAGPDAVLTVPAAGGVVARAADVLVDCSLPRLADLAVEAVAADVQALWTP